MSFLSTYGKKIGAFFILGMLLFIQAEKLLHRHTLNNTCQHEQVQNLKSQNSNCSICEFQISRDAQLSDLEIPSIVPVFLSEEHFTISSSYHFLEQTSLPARGP